MPARFDENATVQSGGEIKMAVSGSEAAHETAETATMLLALHRGLCQDAREFVRQNGEELGINADLADTEDLGVVWTQVERILVLNLTNPQGRVPSLLQMRQRLAAGESPLSLLRNPPVSTRVRKTKTKTKN